MNIRTFTYFILFHTNRIWYKPLLLTLLLCCSLTISLLAQSNIYKGLMVCQSTKEKIAFASISWKRSGKGGMTDSTGHFVIPVVYQQDTLIVTHVGYESLSYAVDLYKNAGDPIIELTQKQESGVVVLAKYNKGELWWKKVVRRKPLNNPFQYSSYSCQLYKKMEMDLNNVTREGLGKVKLLKPFDFILNNIDSTSAEKPFLPVFLTESISQYYFNANPFKKREEIVAVQTSGIKNEMVLHFLNGFSQKINIYENYANLFGKEFISPISNFGNAYYNYQAADTQYVKGQCYLHLFFSPKREGENTFSGDCWIHARTWAIQKIKLNISLTANINYVNRMSIFQEFSQLTDSTWIFATDRFEAELSPLKTNKLSMLVRQTTYYDQVRVNPPGIMEILAKNRETDEILQVDSAKIRPTAYWITNRLDPLSVNEQKVYQMADTLKNIPLFKTYTENIEFVFSGRKKLGKFEIGPWYKWFSFNQLEKFRVRFDLATSNEFSNYLRVHAYLAYGFGDNRWKGQMDLNYKIPGTKGYSIQAAYIHDLDNGNSFRNDDGVTPDNMFNQLIRKHGIKQKFLGVEEIKAGITKEWNFKLSAQLLFSHTNYETFNPLPPKKLISINQRDIINSELGIKLRFAPGEKIIANYRKDKRIQGTQPVFEFSYMMGIPKLFNGRYEYQKISALVSQDFRIPRWGSVNYQVFAGKIWSKSALPFMLLELHPGNENYYYRKQAFNLMNQFEYFSDKYAGFNIEHNFEKKLLNFVPLLNKTNIRQFWNIKAVWGSLSPESKRLNCREEASYRLRSLQGKSYIEVGTGLDNIFKYFRVDLVWRFSPTQKNAAGQYKLPTNSFGVFGSFRIQF